MKTSIEKLTAKRINVRLKVSEAKAIIDALKGVDNEDVEKFVQLVSARLNS